MKIKESAIELHDTLNPKLWDENNNLRPIVKDRLIRIVDKYIESSDVLTKEDVIDVELLGSNASYNYTPHSDLDVHLVVNMEAVSCDPALFQLACNAERSNFNKNYDITIKGIEMYVEDVKASTASNGIYSLYKDEWIKFPQKITVPNYDSDDEYIALLDEWKSLAETVLGSANEAQQVQDYINNLYNLRRTSIMTDGEFGKGNLVFKEIRNEGLLDDLKKKQYKLSSKELSLESVKKLLNFSDHIKYNIIEERYISRLSTDRGFIRSKTFNRMVDDLKLSEESVQKILEKIRNGQGRADVIPGTGGAVKHRIPIIEKGYRDDGRVVYYDIISCNSTFLIALYPKGDKKDLTSEDIAAIERLVTELKEDNNAR